MVKTSNEFKFPHEIKNLIKTIKNEKHWRLLELLISNENKLSYTNIRKKNGFILRR